MSDEFVMSEEIEELAASLNDALENFYEPFDWHEATRIATRLLAAGYRKPRTITTVEELDALPGESVIRDASGIPYELDYTLGNPADKWWVATGMIERLENRHIELPATVLYAPEPSA